MKREEALEQLNAPSAHTRGQAARILRDAGETADIERLRKAARTETVMYVQYALQDTIRKLEQERAPVMLEPDDTEAVSEDVRRQIYGRAVEWITGFLMHEVASQIGLVRLAARSELKGNWDSSDTKMHLANVSRVFDAIETLKSAAGVPKPEEFDFAALIERLVGRYPEEIRKYVSTIGPKPFLIKGDPSLIEMVVVNGLRNAIEAQRVCDSEPQAHDVTINWGSTDLDHWVAILDHGEGLSGPASKAFEIGQSSKKDHTGFGLAIARQAVETMIGGISLEPGKGGGAVYTARWRH